MKDQTTYHLTLLIRDGVLPSQTGTSTLTIRVCRCDAGGDVLSCTAEPQPLHSGGLSRGALLAILACALLSMGNRSPTSSTPGSLRIFSP